MADKMTIKKISIRAYARLNDCSDYLIREAIKAENIKKGYEKKTKKILLDAAEKEWGIKYRARKANKDLKKVSVSELEGIKNISIEEITLHIDDPQSVIEQKHAYIKANRDLLKLKTEAGELQNKEDTYKELFTFGKEVRSALQAIPDRIIDDLLSLDRNSAHKLLSESINETLIKLAND